MPYSIQQTKTLHIAVHSVFHTQIKHPSLTENDRIELSRNLSIFIFPGASLLFKPIVQMRNPQGLEIQTTLESSLNN